MSLLNRYKTLHGDKPGNFHLSSGNGILIWEIPYYIEKYLLRNVKSKKIRIRKKIIKKEIHLAIRRGMDENTL